MGLHTSAPSADPTSHPHPGARCIWGPAGFLSPRLGPQMQRGRNQSLSCVLSGFLTRETLSCRTGLMQPLSAGLFVTQRRGGSTPALSLAFPSQATPTPGGGAQEEPLE